MILGRIGRDAMSKTTQIWFALSFTISMLLIVACSVESGLKVFSNETKCTIPCWNGITPGVTEKEKAIEIVKTSSEIDLNSVQLGFVKQFLYPDYLSFNFQPNSAEYCIIYFENETVQMMEFGDLKIRLETVIEKFGEPKDLIFYIWGNNLAVNIIYPDFKLWISYSRIKPEKNTILISEKAIITDIWFLSTSSAELLLEEQFSDYFQRFAEKMQIIRQPWKGYGTYEIPDIND